MAEETSASDNNTTSAPVRADAQQGGKGTFVPLIFGGAVACALGFFGGQIDAVEERLGFGDSDDSALVEQLDAQAATISEQSTAIEALTTRLEEVANATPEIDLSAITGAIEEQSTGLTEQSDALATQADALAAQTSALADLASRVEDVEKRPMTEGLSEEAIAAYEAELERLQGSVTEQQAEMQSVIGAQQTEMQTVIAAQQAELQAVIDAQRAEIETLIADAKTSETSAAAQAQAALARAAMSQIITAVESGAPYADALAELRAAGGTEVPDALAATAESGVPTLTTLQTEFPAAARAALAAARSEDSSDESGGGLGSFLQKQLGARSVTPRDGDDPDAVLSRTEAAVREGRLGDALGEVASLPEGAKAALSDWLALAETRHAASEASNQLMSALAAN